MAVRTEPHPRYYTSQADDVPLAVPALLRTNWWPMISFVVFKAPPEGRVHIFRPGEPFMQMVFLPAEPQFELVPMDEEEAAEREMRGRRIHASRDTLGKESRWCSSTNTVFDGTYRQILRAARRKPKRTAPDGAVHSRLRNPRRNWKRLAAADDHADARNADIGTVVMVMMVMVVIRLVVMMVMVMMVVGRLVAGVVVILNQFDVAHPIGRRLLRPQRVIGFHHGSGILNGREQIGVG